MSFVVFKKGGEPGEVAVNCARVTHIRSAAGPFTDVYFGEHRVAVEGTFRDVVNKVAGEEVVKPPRSLDFLQPPTKPMR